MMRAGALSFSRWRRSLLSRSGGRWLTAQVSSMPSFVSCRVAYIAPALLMSTFSFGKRASTSKANLRTEACDERSAINVATVAPFLAAALMRADAMRILVLLRPTMASQGALRNSVPGRAGDSFDKIVCLAASLSPLDPTTHSRFLPTRLGFRDPYAG